MIQPIPRQSLSDPDFYSEEFQWLSKKENGWPCRYPVVPLNGWDSVETTVLVDNGSEYKSITVSKLSKPSLGGYFQQTETTYIHDETVVPYGTMRVTDYDVDFTFVKNS